MDNFTIITAIMTGGTCGVLGVLIGRITKPSTTFDPFTYYRARVRQIVDAADKQSDLQAELRQLDLAFSHMFPETKK